MAKPILSVDTVARTKLSGQLEAIRLFKSLLDRPSVNTDYLMLPRDSDQQAQNNIVYEQLKMILKKGNESGLEGFASILTDHLSFITTGTPSLEYFARLEAELTEAKEGGDNDLS